MRKECNYGNLKDSLKYLKFISSLAFPEAPINNSLNFAEPVALVELELMASTTADLFE